MKKALLVILTVIVVLLPTIVGVVLYLIPDDIIPTPVNVSGVFYDENGNKYEFNRSKNPLLASFFDGLEERSSLTSITLDRLTYDAKFSAELDGRNGTEAYTLYMSASGRSYYTAPDGSFRHIDAGYANTLLCSEYAISIYEKLNTPTLNTFSNESIIPGKVAFKYTAKNGTSLDGKNIKTTSEVATYYSSKTTSFSFSTRPDICNVRVSIGGVEMYNGALYDFDPTTIPAGSTVRYDIDATWVATACYGTASYSFIVCYSPAPEFVIERTSVEAGEFIILKARNIIDTNKISYTFAYGAADSIQFFNAGDFYYAFIPVDIDTPTGNYSLSVECGETKQSTSISVSARNRSASDKIYTVDAPLSEQALADMNALISSIGQKCSDKVFGGAPFVNFEQEYSKNFYLTLGYGRVRKFNVGIDFDMIGVEFSSTVGADIPAINAGVVCASGEDAVLGKYVVVDHGFGFKSWYCNISEATVSVGDTVESGAIVAKTGTSAFYSQPGLYLITTVYGTPVSPYAIYENGFKLPR